MNIEVLNKEGNKIGKKVNLNKDIFNIIPNEHAIYLDVKQYMANRRRGTHNTRERSEVVGSQRKIKKQKGTGTARAGNIKNPLFRGGGVVFGPKPRDYSFKLNKKLKKLARKSALSLKLQQDSIYVIDDFACEKPQTKQIVTLQKNLKLQDKKTLLILEKIDDNIHLSARNLKNFDIKKIDKLNTYSILNSSVLLFSEKSIEILNKSENK